MTRVRIIDNEDGLRAVIYVREQRLIKKIADLVSNRAKAICPVRSGNLQTSIKVILERNRAFIGSDLYYATYVEGGTQFMAARPFLRPAILEVLSELKVKAKIEGVIGSS